MDSDLTTVKRGKATSTTIQDRAGNCLAEERQILNRQTEYCSEWELWAVQWQGQWRSISTELSQSRHRGRPPHPPQRSGDCSTIIEYREVTWSWQHPSRTGRCRWRRSNHRSNDNLQQDLIDRRMANHMEPVLGHHTSQERQPAAVPQLPNDQPHHPPKQNHAKDHAEQIEAASREDHCWRTGRLQSRKEHYRADLQPKNPLWEISPAPARPLSFLSRL